MAFLWFFLINIPSIILLSNISAKNPLIYRAVFLDVLKLCDFGLAERFVNQQGDYKLMDAARGTQPYMAPEMISGLWRPEPADIWSCGVVLAVMLIGARPWDSTLSQRFLEWIPFKTWQSEQGKRMESGALCKLFRHYVLSLKVKV
ncbi:unnamed protein product [Soboliphyme baturini]|uniref:Protein kinase domain-containing protein n=1 Tax=Soboliphyme baturini TaxID=241478 RepID=A0A183IM16_9BILA|nr:unnamed protein product [Soboliphyme baturini]